MRALVVLSATVHVPVSVVHSAATFYGAIRAREQWLPAPPVFTARYACPGRKEDVDGNSDEAEGGGGVGKEEDEDEDGGSVPRSGR